MLGLLLFVHGRRRVGVILALGVSGVVPRRRQHDELLGSSNEAFGRRFAGERGDSVGEAFLWMARAPARAARRRRGRQPRRFSAPPISTGGLALLAPSWLLALAPDRAAQRTRRRTASSTTSYITTTSERLTGLFVASASAPDACIRSRAGGGSPSYASGVGRRDSSPSAWDARFTSRLAFDTRQAAAIERALERIPRDAPSRRPGACRAPEPPSRGVLAPGAVSLRRVGYVAHDRRARRARRACALRRLP